MDPEANHSRPLPPLCIGADPAVGPHPPGGIIGEALAIGGLALGVVGLQQATGVIIGVGERAVLIKGGCSRGEGGIGCRKPTGCCAGIKRVEQFRAAFIFMLCCADFGMDVFE